MVSICAAIGGGLSAEDRTTNGISHLAASMLLKGTVSRKEGEIRGGLERRGGGIAPFSGYDSYGLNIAVLKEDVDYGLELLKDIVANSTFPQEEIDKEKEEILARIKEADDDMFEKGAHLVMKELFGDHPYGLRGIGDAESVRSLTREALIDYHATRRVPGNMVVSVSGDIYEASAARKLTGLFEDVGMGSAAPHDTGAAPAGRKRCVVEMDKEQSLILIAFRTTDIKDHDRFVLDLVGSIMSGQSGRLFNELRNRRSFGYTLGCVQRMGLKGGSILFYIATSKKKLPAAEKALFDEISRLKTATVTDEELTMAREELKTQHAAKLETNSFVAMQASLDELRGLGFDEIYQYRRELDKVTKDDIKRAALKYLDSDKCATVVISGLLNTRSS
jgi:zinc protease